MDTFWTEARSNLRRDSASAWTPAQASNASSDFGEMALSLDQAAPLLESVEIAMQPSQRIFHLADLRALAIQYPCQIRIPMLGDFWQESLANLHRGIQVTNRIDGIAACQKLFTRKVQGAFPEYLLLEPQPSRAPSLSLSIRWENKADGFWLGITQAENAPSHSPWAEPPVGERFFGRQDLGSDDDESLALELGLEASTVNAIAHLIKKLDILITWAGLSACQLNGWIEPFQIASAQVESNQVKSIQIEPSQVEPSQVGPDQVKPNQRPITVQGGWLRFAADSPLRRQAKAALQSRTVIHPAIVVHRESDNWRRPAALFPAETSPIREGPANAAKVSPPPASAPKANARKAKDTEVSSVKAPNNNWAPLTQPEVLSPGQPKPTPFDSPRVVRLGEGNIAVISNGLARTMATLGQLQQRGGSVAAFVNLQEAGGANANSQIDDEGKAKSKTEMKAMGLGMETYLETHLPLANLMAADPFPLDAFTVKRQLAQALEALARVRGVKVILINWRSSSLPCRILAEALIEYQSKIALQARRPAQPLPLVVRMAGEGAEMGYQRLLDQEAIALEVTVEAAISRSMGLARMGKYLADG